jgi:hypothetical protein
MTRSVRATRESPSRRACARRPEGWSVITLRRSNERCHQRRGSREVWLTFCEDADKEGSLGCFGMLESLDEGLLAPRAKGARQRHSQGDVVT